MKLYDFTIAPNPRRVRIFLAEKGVEIPIVQIDLMQGEQFSPEFSQKCPSNEVPLLELDNGVCISQVDAICRYIEAKYPQNPLYGTTPEEIGLIEMWNHIAFMNGIGAVAESFRNGAEAFKNRAVVGPNPHAQIPALIERGNKRTLEFFANIDGHLASRQFMAGDRYSIADITTLVAVDFAKWIKLEAPAELVHLTRWYTEVSRRPSAQA